MFYEPLRGFKDYTPPESELLTWICQSFADVVKRFGYREVKTPTVESFQLFALKSGEEIRESMFVFKDKAGREVALRPEITPSIVRLYLKEMRHLPKPIRVYYIGNVFRYDEPQFGRYREFTQAGVEILGGDGIEYDVELIEILEEFYDVIGLKNRSYKVNNVAIFREIASRAGINGIDLDKLLHYLDKGVYSKAIELFLSKGAYDEAKVIEELASVREETNKIEIINNILSKLKNPNPILKHVEVLERYIDMVKNIGANIIIEPAFARGIAYYTDIIFEVLVPNISISIAGGGRYNGLTRVYGGEDLSTTGFAIGVERTMLALTSNRVAEVPTRIPKLLMLLLVDDVSTYAKVYMLAKNLRKRNICVQLEVTSVAKLSKWLEYADRYGVDYVAIIGKKEIEKSVITIKDMKSWTQKEVGIEELHKIFT